MTLATRGGVVSLFGHDPAEYQPHSLHASARSYLETNCYTDILLELVYAAGLEPLAMLGGTVRCDFEGDQWTFFKPFPEDLESLYGIDIHEMQPYRPLPVQVAEQLERRRTLIVELDSFYLPDTHASSYRREHVKSSIAVEAVDVSGERLRYYHNLSLHELSGEDFRGVFRLGRPFSDDVLPPYTELVRFDRGEPLRDQALRGAARSILRRHLAKRPQTNPFESFGRQLQVDLPQLLEGNARTYHDYAFATVRMVGAAFELAAAHVEWLFPGETDAVDRFMKIVEGCKTLSFRLARQRAFDPKPRIAPLASAWDEAVARLDSLVQ